jgi:threonyl-tRNA synthetase
MDINIARHSLAHVMAQAVMELFPDTQLGIGPAIDDGFYYDFGLKEPLTAEHFGFIEDRMAKIIKAQLPLTCGEYPSKDAALKAFAGQVYKEELIRDLDEGDTVTSYITGDGGFMDLCKGPHVADTRELLGWAYKIHSVAGAYWRGSEKNPMLTRLYAYAFPTKNELKAHIAKIEEAKKRDHRKLGPQLELFELFEEGPGFPFFLPNGMLVRNVLERFWETKHLAAGYDEIKTPVILSESLWHRSGHWNHYQKNMYFTDIDEGAYAIKPMNCPGAMLAYKRGLHSYRELPIRLAERGLVHRHELSGALHGLMRVRCFTQDDAHIFMTPEQIEGEILSVLRLIDDFYSTFGFSYKIELSTRPEDFMGEAADWDKAEDALKQALTKAGKEFTINEGDGAFYGPKIDCHLEDCLGRTWQCGTIQLDFQMPERFDLHYVGTDGARHRPVMIHHVVLGSIERFMGILIEHFAGAFPFWLAPVQIGIVPVRTNHNDRAAEVSAILSKVGLRCKALLEDEGMGGKVNAFRKGKVPYTLIIGDSEVEAGTVSVKIRGGAQAQNIPLDWFLAACVRLRDERGLELAEGFTS